MNSRFGIACFTIRKIRRIARALPLLIACLVAVWTNLRAQSAGLPGPSLPNLFPLADPTGFVETYKIDNTAIDLTGPFFQSLGRNGRSCGSCHRPAEAWSVSAAEVQLRFLLTQGLDPIFRTNDGSNCDQNIDTSTVEGRRSAYGLLLSRGLLRIALTVPANAQLTVVSVRNPYGCSDTSLLSVYRRPLPATNLRFLSAVMFDGRESSPQTGTEKITYATNPTVPVFPRQQAQRPAGSLPPTARLTSRKYAASRIAAATSRARRLTASTCI